LWFKERVIGMKLKALIEMVQSSETNYELQLAMPQQYN
jgi:hypothetical protein